MTAYPRTRSTLQCLSGRAFSPHALCTLHAQSQPPANSFASPSEGRMVFPLSASAISLGPLLVSWHPSSHRSASVTSPARSLLRIHGKEFSNLNFGAKLRPKEAIVLLHERVSVRASHESPPHGHGVPHVSHSAGGITRPSSGGPAGLSSGTAPVRWGSPVPDAARWGTEAEGLAIAAARRLGRGLRGLAV